MAARDALLLQQSQYKQAVRYERRMEYKVNAGLREERTQYFQVLTDLHVLEICNVSTTFNEKIGLALLQIS